MKRLLPLALLALASPAAAQAPAPREPTRSLDLSADGRLFDQWFQRFGHHPGRTVAPERAGVRLQLPAVKQEVMSGYSSAFSLAGDFEVAFDLDLVSVVAPTAGYGPAVGVTVDAEGEDGSIGLVRGVSAATAAPQFVVVRAVPNSGGPATVTADVYSATGTRARLVLRREKDTVVALAGDKPGGEMRELKRLSFTDRRVRHLRLHAGNGGSPTALTGRLTNVRVRADEIVGGLTQAELKSTRSYWWWWVPVAGVALTAALFVRRRRRGGVPE